jgi:hypothetical protein
MSTLDLLCGLPAASQPVQLCLFKYRSAHWRCSAVVPALEDTPVERQDKAQRFTAMVARLELLVKLRKLYRNLVRAGSLLRQPSPNYKRPQRLAGMAFGAVAPEV